MENLGELGLASRLHRLADRLQADVSAIYSELGLEFEARWFPVLVALHRDGPANVTDLARSLGISHQAVSQTAHVLIRRDLVKETVDAKDRRRKALSLSRKGRRLCQRLEPVWEQIREANRELLADVGVDLVADIEQVEAALSKQGIAGRVRDHLGLPPKEPVQIVGYRPAYKKHFRRLNLDWIEDDFVVETKDRKLLEDPNRVVRRGGEVLFAILGDEVIGTCALLRHDAATWELTKMAVDRNRRRQGHGRRLARAVIERATEEGASRLWLRTSPLLRGAERLYRSLGFRRSRRHPFQDEAYERETLAMVLNLPLPEEKTS